MKNRLLQLGWLMFGISTLFFFYEFILRVSPGIMTQQLLATYHIKAEQLGFMSSAFFYSYALLQIPVGIIFDHYSTRKTLFLSCLVCSLGTLLFSSSSIFVLGFIGRMLIGVGAAFGFVGVLKVAEQRLPKRLFAVSTGILASLGFLGAIVSDNILHWLIQHSTWQSMMFKLGLLGLLLSSLLYLFVRDNSPYAYLQMENKKVSALFKKSGNLNVENIEDNATRQNDSSYLQNFNQNAIGINDKQDDLIIKNFDVKSGSLYHNLTDIFKKPSIWLNGLIGLCLYAPTNAFAELWGKDYLTHVFHFSSPQAVFAITLIFLGWAIGSPIVGLISDFTRQRRYYFTIGSVISCLFLSLLLFNKHFNFSVDCFILFFFGFFSSVEILNFPYAKELVEHQLSSTAIATTNMLTMMAGIIFQPIIGFLLDLNWQGQIQNGVRQYPSYAYEHAFLLLPITLLCAAIISLFLQKTSFER